jgi:hypothetical protein
MKQTRECSGAATQPPCGELLAQRNKNRSKPDIYVGVLKQNVFIEVTYSG